MGKFVHVHEGRIYKRFEADSVPAHKASYLLPYVESVDDQSTGSRKVTTVEETIHADKVEHVTSIRDMTAQELDDEKQQQVDREIDLLQFKILFNHENRIRDLESKNPITKAQFRAALKAEL